MFGVNGTAVQQGITLGPYSINFDGYSFEGAGGWALQRAVTRLKVHWSTPSPPVQREYRYAAPAVDGRPALCHGPRGGRGSGGGFARLARRVEQLGIGIGSRIEREHRIQFGQLENLRNLGRGG